MGMYDRDWYRHHRRQRREQPQTQKPPASAGGSSFNLPNFLALIFSFLAVSYLLRSFF